MTSDALSPSQFSPQDEHIRNAQMGQLPLPIPEARYRGEQVSNWPHEVEVYRNLNTKTIGHEPEDVVYSVRDKGSGKVVGYSEDITLDQATPKVGSAGRRKVQETGQKNVHAVIRGTPSTRKMGPSKRDSSLYYNPKDERIPDAFVDAPALFGKGEAVPVESAERVRLKSKGTKPDVRYRR